MEMQPLTVYHAAAIICISLMSCEVELLKQNGYWPFSILCSEPDVFQGPLPETTCQLTRKEKYISDKLAFLKGLFFFLHQNFVFSSLLLLGGSIFLYFFCNDNNNYTWNQMIIKVGKIGSDPPSSTACSTPELSHNFYTFPEAKDLTVLFAYAQLLLSDLPYLPPPPATHALHVPSLPPKCLSLAQQTRGGVEMRRGAPSPSSKLLSIPPARLPPLFSFAPTLLSQDINSPSVSHQAICHHLLRLCP